MDQDNVGPVEANDDELVEVESGILVACLRSLLPDVLPVKITRGTLQVVYDGLHNLGDEEGEMLASDLWNSAFPTPGGENG